MKALTTVGDLPRPRTKGEYIYVTTELFFGLFLFASVLGHVANIVTNVSAARKEFQGKWGLVEFIWHVLARKQLPVTHRHRLGGELDAELSGRLLASSSGLLPG